VIVSQNQTTAAGMLERAGRALFDSPDWQARLAAALGVGRSTIQYWRNGRIPFGRDHGAFNDLLALLRRRRGELESAEKELSEWLGR
jgi:hypothetical protein